MYGNPYVIARSTSDEAIQKMTPLTWIATLHMLPVTTKPDCHIVKFIRQFSLFGSVVDTCQ